VRAGEWVRIRPFQPVKENWNAVTFLNCNCISPESPGRRLIEDIEFSFGLKRAYYGRRRAVSRITPAWGAG
jgi:hypothetical protein